MLLPAAACEQAPLMGGHPHAHGGIWSHPPCLQDMLFVGQKQLNTPAFYEPRAARH